MNKIHDRVEDGVSDNTARFSASRRSFFRASKLALGAGLALGVGLSVGSRPANADGENGGIDCGRGNDHTSEGKSMPSCGKCFLQGTQIATDKGVVSVESLKIGDAVLTVSGEAKPIKWIGKRKFERTRDLAAAPVKISRFAIDGKFPTADLYVSPAHAIYVDGILIPIANLVNGVTIVANARKDLQTINYYHIEFDAHEVIFAEGLPVESYLAQGAGGFDNESEYLSLYGPRVEPMVPFAPIVSFNGGRQEFVSHLRSVIAPISDIRKPLDKVRDRLNNQSEMRLTA